MSATATAVLGGGCFWCLEACFELVRGVSRSVSGYAAGKTAAPTYEAVCSGTTGHAEVIQLTFDPTVVTYRELIELFLVVHDPTTLNRQGADVGTQYRSIILTLDDEQERCAREVITQFDTARVWPAPIVTEVAKLDRFYPAEAYHQGYFRTHPQQSYCQAVIAPKVAKLRAKYTAKLQA